MEVNEFVLVWIFYIYIWENVQYESITFNSRLKWLTITFIKYIWWLKLHTSFRLLVSVVDVASVANDLTTLGKALVAAGLFANKRNIVYMCACQ